MSSCSAWMYWFPLRLFNILSLAFIVLCHPGFSFFTTTILFFCCCCFTILAVSPLLLAFVVSGGCFICLWLLSVYSPGFYLQWFTKYFPWKSQGIFITFRFVITQLPTCSIFFVLLSSCLKLQVVCDICFFISHIHRSAQFFRLLFTGSVLGFFIAYYLPFLTLVSFLQVHPAYGCQNNLSKTLFESIATKFKEPKEGTCGIDLCTLILPGKVNWTCA